MSDKQSNETAQNANPAGYWLRWCPECNAAPKTRCISASMGEERSTPCPGRADGPTHRPGQATFPCTCRWFHDRDNMDCPVTQRVAKLLSIPPAKPPVPERCSCGNEFDGDNLCMVSACQWEGVSENPSSPGQTS